jgi:glycosyltransferase involved in cell wall biosynthesis
MIYLFVHQNFPGQYRHIVCDLVADPSNQVYFITQPNEHLISGVHKITYPKDTRGLINCHAYSSEFDRAVHAGAMVADVCRNLLSQGITPDLIIGHGGWGETMFIKDVFPDVPLLANFEFYYHATGVDVDFDPEFTSIFHDPSRLRVRNAVHLLNFQGVDWGHSATGWQRSLHPLEMQSRISVLHEGVDTAIACPDPEATYTLPNGKELRYGDEVVTYVARNLEPYRGFHIFMRALPHLLKRRPQAQVVIVGGDGVSYGMSAPPSSTYREMMLRELGNGLDHSRVHFVGVVDHHSYLKLLQVSAAHVYLTYPFVLSWSFIEALACGCLVIASSTPPVLEVLRDGVNGLAVDFFAPLQLANRIEQALDVPEEFEGLRRRARATAVSQFDLPTLLLPKWRALFSDLIDGRQPSLVP